VSWDNEAEVAQAAALLGAWQEPDMAYALKLLSDHKEFQHQAHTTSLGLFPLGLFPLGLFSCHLCFISRATLPTQSLSCFVILFVVSSSSLMFLVSPSFFLCLVLAC